MNEIVPPVMVSVRDWKYEMFAFKELTVFTILCGYSLYPITKVYPKGTDPELTKQEDIIIEYSDLAGNAIGTTINDILFAFYFVGIPFYLNGELVTVKESISETGKLQHLLVLLENDLKNGE